MVAFANLLDGLEGYSKRFKRRVARVTHDVQSEFEETLAIWHEMFSNASPEEVRWAGETYSLQKVVGSEFDQPLGSGRRIPLCFSPRGRSEVRRDTSISGPSLRRVPRRRSQIGRGPLMYRPAERLTRSS